MTSVVDAKITEENRTNTLGEIAENLKEKGTSLLKKAVLKASGPLVQTIETSIELQKNVNECVKEGHHELACSIGIPVQIAVSHTTSHVAEAVILSSVAEGPVGLITAPIGVYTYLNTSEIGKSFGNIAVKMVDYLIDHMPSDMLINSDKPVIVKYKEKSIVLQKDDISLVNNLIMVNRTTNKMINEISSLTNNVKNKINEHTTEYQKSVQEFDAKTKELIIKLDDTYLDNLLEQKFSQILTINTDVIQRPIPKYTHPVLEAGNYVKIVGKNGDWKVVCTVFSIGSNGIKCVIL